MQIRKKVLDVSAASGRRLGKEEEVKRGLCSELDGRSFSQKLFLIADSQRMNQPITSDLE
jgi:hypothetical protein